MSEKFTSSVLKHVGSLLPLVLLFFIAIIGIQTQVFGNPIEPYERAGIYIVAIIFGLLGTYACFKIAFGTGRSGISLFLYTILLREISLIPALVAFVLSVFGVSIADSVFFAMLLTSLLAISMSNLVLFLSLRHDILEEEIDPIPFRPEIKALFRRKKK